MDTIGIKELRQNASVYLALVEAGKEFGVTNNGRLVARLLPVTAETTARESLIRGGTLRPARIADDLANVASTGDIAASTASSVLDDMRNET